ncbi:hypothetical protein PO909_005633 [Leuciscus waleckii]
MNGLIYCMHPDCVIQLEKEKCMERMAMDDPSSEPELASGTHTFNKEQFLKSLGATRVGMTECTVMPRLSHSRLPERTRMAACDAIPRSSRSPLGNRVRMTVHDAMPRHSRSPLHKKTRSTVCAVTKPRHSRPLLQSPADSSMRFENAVKPSHASSVHPWSQVSVALHTQTPLRAASRVGSLSSTSLPLRGTSVVPLVPLVRPLVAWLVLPRPTRWLIRTIRLSYGIQFARRPPKFRCIRFTTVMATGAPALRTEIEV